jgi:hypothetical protein
MYKLNVNHCLNGVLIGSVVYFHMRSASGKTYCTYKNIQCCVNFGSCKVRSSKEIYISFVHLNQFRWHQGILPVTAELNVGRSRV